jgi:hypothetical protein
VGPCLPDEPARNAGGRTGQCVELLLTRGLYVIGSVKFLKLDQGSNQVA